MENQEQPKDIVVTEKPDPASTSFQEELGEYLGFPDPDEQKIIADLNRLHHSLRGPENLLDKGNYSRPYPPTYQNPGPNPKPQQTTSAAAAGAAGASRRQGG
jgi:hypothetical protein